MPPEFLRDFLLEIGKSAEKIIESLQKIVMFNLLIMSIFLKAV
jgi:hypothetical protein